MVVWGVAYQGVVLNSMTYRQQVTPEPLLGRVNTAGRMLSFGVGWTCGALGASALAGAGRAAAGPRGGGGGRAGRHGVRVALAAAHHRRPRPGGRRAVRALLAGARPDPGACGSSTGCVEHLRVLQACVDPSRAGCRALPPGATSLGTLPEPFHATEVRQPAALWPAARRRRATGCSSSSHAPLAADRPWREVGPVLRARRARCDGVRPAASARCPRGVDDRGAAWCAPCDSTGAIALRREPAGAAPARVWRPRSTTCSATRRSWRRTCGNSLAQCFVARAVRG